MRYPQRPLRAVVCIALGLFCLGWLGTGSALAELRSWNPDGLVLSRDYSQVSVAKSGKRSVYISAQGPVRPGKPLGPNVPIRDQAQRMIENIDRALKSVGATPSDVARIHTYVTNFRFMTAIVVGQEMRRFFGNKMPVSTFIPVDTLIWPHANLQTDLLVVLDH